MRKVLVLVFLASILGLTLYSFRADPVVEPGTGVVDPTPAQDVGPPSALWVGDDFTAGLGASEPRVDGYACRTSITLGWTCNLDAQAGTGYINNGRTNDDTYLPFKDRLTTVRRKYLADVIFVDGGRNDGNKGVNLAGTAAENFLKRLRALWPDAEIVVIAPYYLASTRQTYGFGVGLTDRLKPVVKAIDAHLIDPIGKGWIPPPDLQKLLSDNKVHPNDEGHRYLAKKLTAELRGLGIADVKVTDKRGPAFD